MALWKWVAGVGTATVSIIAAPVADSLVKEGKLPDGLGAVLSTLSAWLSTSLTTQVSVPLWSALLVFLSIGISLRGLIMTRRQLLQGIKPMPTPPKLDQEMQALSRHNQELASTNAQLQQQLVTFTEIRREQQNENAALEAEIATQKEASADLKQQLATMSQTAKEAEVEIPAYAIKTLSAIATLTNRGFKPNLVLLNNAVGGRVEVEGAIDILFEHKMAQTTDTSGTPYYSLTPKGRAYYLAQNSKQAG